ncbi:hypothetical protein MRB53_038886 [Persea americana]|nr:hypothetical protein MRB53_038886 [Persea americana]
MEATDLPKKNLRLMNQRPPPRTGGFPFRFSVRKSKFNLITCPGQVGAVVKHIREWPHESDPEENFRHAQTRSDNPSPHISCAVILISRGRFGLETTPRSIGSSPKLHKQSRPSDLIYCSILYTSSCHNCKARIPEVKKSLLTGYLQPAKDNASRPMLMTKTCPITLSTGLSRQ